MKVALLALLLAACAASPLEPDPRDDREFTAPAAWRAIYAQVEACAGMPEGRYDGIRWFWADSAIASSSGGWGQRDYYGEALEPERIIILIRGDTTYLRHEMLHDVLYQHGWRPPAGASYADLHPSPPFGVCAP